MGVVEELARAREAYERRDWMAAYGALSGADPTMLTADDLDRLATAALLLGRRNDSVAALQRAYRVSLEADDQLGAVRCALHLALALQRTGEGAVAGGWSARARTLLDETGHDTVERGYLHYSDCLAGIAAGRFAEARSEAGLTAEHGRRFRDPNLLALGTCTQGRFLMMGGEVRQGLAALDEAMVSVAAGELRPVYAGEVYCTTIEGCQEVGDFGRAAQWTTALTRWSDTQPDLVMFTGQCAVHRGQIMRLHGAFAEALAEFDRARERYALADTPAAAGLAFAERGDVLRLTGDLAGAEVAYAEAARNGREARSGLALLWLAMGRDEAALGAVRRLLAEAGNPVERSQILPAAVEVLLSCGHLDEAESAAIELDQVAVDFGCDGLSATAARAAAKVSLGRGEAAAALERLREAMRLWGALRAPYELATCRVLVARAYELLGDAASAAREQTAADAAFTALGVPSAVTAPGSSLLSPRELEVLRLVAGGSSNAEVAATLVLSEKTVARHLSNIFDKLGVGSRTAAAAYAYEQGLVGRPH